jgi:hypothetical protein
MVLIKVQYDAYNRDFKIIDRELAHKLEDGETYALIADVSVEDFETERNMALRETQPAGPPTR